MRLALGATSRDLIRQAVGAGLWPVAIGAVAGLGLAALLATAGWLAALRIRHVQPADVLRAE